MPQSNSKILENQVYFPVGGLKLLARQFAVGDTKEKDSERDYGKATRIFKLNSPEKLNSIMTTKIS